MEVDSIAQELTKEINDRQDGAQTKSSGLWEHEELAQVKIKVYRGHTGTVKSCQFCDGDRKILTASFDKTVCLWDFDSGDVLQCYEGGHSMYINQARACPDMSRFVSCGWDKKINVWNIETGSILWSGEHGGIVMCCAFSYDGMMVVSGSDLDNIIKVWDAYTGECIHEIKDLHSSTITSVQFSPNNDKIISTSMDKTTRFWDLTTKCNTISLDGHTNIISDASLSSDERKLATVSWDKSIQIWDVSTGMYRSQGPSSIAKAHEGCISSCDFSPDGLQLVTGSYDSTISLWDAEHMAQKLRLQGHSDWIEDVCFSDNQKWIMSSSKDTTVRAWNIEETEHIPMVVEQKKAIGIKVLKCSKCGKPFSMSQVEDVADIRRRRCVFCRLHDPDHIDHSMAIKES